MGDNTVEDIIVKDITVEDKPVQYPNEPYYAVSPDGELLALFVNGTVTIKRIKENEKGDTGEENGKPEKEDTGEENEKEENIQELGFFKPQFEPPLQLTPPNLPFPYKPVLYKYSFAISDDREGRIFVAFSEFDEYVDVDEDEDVDKKNTTYFFVYSHEESLCIGNYIKRGGVLKFVNHRKLVIFTISGGILKLNLEDLPKQQKSKISKIPEPYQYPPTLDDPLSFDLLGNCTVKKYFFLLDSKNKVQMYNLDDEGNLELLFPALEEPFIGIGPKETKTIPKFAISGNNKFLATTGSRSFSIYLMENGLSVANVDFGGKIKILFLGFYKNDKRLAVFTENRIFTYDVHGWDTKKNRTFKFHLKKDSILKVSNGRVLFFESTKCFDLIETSDKKLVLSDLINHSNQIEIEEEDSGQVEAETISNEEDFCQTIPSIELFEPWNKNRKVAIYAENKHKFERLNEDKILHIGPDTIQLWKKYYYGGVPFSLEFIWTKDIDSKEVIENVKYLGDRKFEITLKENDNSYVSIRFEKEIKTVEIKIPKEPNQKSIRLAVKALNFFRHKSKSKSTTNKIRETTEKIKTEIENFIKAALDKKDPNFWRILDVNHHIVDLLIETESRNIIKTILEKKLHIPFTESYPQKTGSTLTNAINKQDAETIQNLLDYYTENVAEHIGWMYSVTGVLATLYKCFPEIAKRLVKKPAFGTNKMHLDELHYRHIYDDIPEKKEIHPYTLDITLYPDKKDAKEKVKSSQTTTTTRGSYIVPLPNLISRSKRTLIELINDAFQKTFDSTYSAPANSPLHQLIYCDRDGELLDNPAIRAAIIIELEQKNQFFFYLKTFFYWIYLVFFMVWCKFLLDQMVFDIDRERFIHVSAILVIIVSSAMTFVELIRILRVGPTYYWSTVYNWFDFISCVFPLTIVSHVLSTDDSFCLGAFNRCKSNVVLISFSSLILCIQLFLRLRFIPKIGEYVYLIINIIDSAYMFLLSQVAIAAAFAYSMHILLHYSRSLGVLEGTTTFSGTDSKTNSIITISQEVDPSSYTDNYFESWWKSWEAVYFWLSGRWDQVNQWNYWPVDVITLLASVFLVTVLQNLLIAHMNNAYEDAKKKSERGLLQTKTKMSIEGDEFREAIYLILGIDTYGESISFDMPVYREFEKLLRKTNTRRRKRMHEYIYYATDKSIIEKWEKNIEEEDATIVDVSSRLKKIGKEIKHEIVEDKPTRKIENPDISSRLEKIENSIWRIENANVSGSLRTIEENMSDRLKTIENNIGKILSKLEN